MVRRLGRRGFHEGLRVRRRRPNAEGQIAHGAKSHHKPSILQELEGGRPMEIDALYGVTLDLARTHGMATPTLELLVAMVRARARQAGLYSG